MAEQRFDAERTQPLMVYAWGNNERRAQLQGRECVVLARGRMNTILVQFLDTGEKVTTSRFAVKRAT